MDFVALGITISNMKKHNDQRKHMELIIRLHVTCIYVYFKIDRKIITITAIH